MRMYFADHAAWLMQFHIKQRMSPAILHRYTAATHLPYKMEAATTVYGLHNSISHPFVTPCIFIIGPLISWYNQKQRYAPSLVEVFEAMWNIVEIWPRIGRFGPALLHNLDVLGGCGSWRHRRATQRRRFSHFLDYLWQFDNRRCSPTLSRLNTNYSYYKKIK